mmetsp:Transcript_70315/g.195726  ORF Transcript_70315/g.195726 Transcript_70315/m.195726 type:complete len:263 (+) Transcript_70315:1623-2411(+)
MHQGVSETSPQQWLHTDNDIRFCDLLDDVLVAEDPHLEVLGATNKLGHAVVVDVAKIQGAHVITSDRPEQLGTFVVEGLYRAIAAHDASGDVGGSNVAEGDDVDAVMHLLKEEVRILLHVVNHQRSLRPDHHNVVGEARVEHARAHRRDFTVDVQELHLVVIVLGPIVRAVDDHLTCGRASGEARVVAIVPAHGDEALQHLVAQRKLERGDHGLPNSQSLLPLGNDRRRPPTCLNDLHPTPHCWRPRHPARKDGSRTTTARG